MGESLNPHGRGDERPNIWPCEVNARHINSDEVREAIAEQRQVISRERLEAGWAGAEPAGEESIVAAEERLGVSLPLSYRNFLRVSDGWEDLGSVDLFPVGDIGWFTDPEANLLEAWSDAPPRRLFSAAQAMSADR
ncbi:SMI1/KNR4 family protein [Streptomyces microflavus]|uniref:SMI1/KNR4 family protein n=1 Tax=Streptomyces microflavus TaxID=1919 RepID=UPI0036E7861E